MHYAEAVTLDDQRRPVADLTAMRFNQSRSLVR
jgi:hypothetical protein